MSGMCVSVGGGLCVPSEHLPHHIDTSGAVSGAHGGLGRHPHRGPVEGLPPVEQRQTVARLPGGLNFRSVEASHDQLGVVVAKAWQQVSRSPIQEVVEGVGGALLHPYLVSVAPDLQAGQRHPHVQRTVELEEEGKLLVLLLVWTNG